MRLADGTVVALEQGAPVPADADPAAVERLARFGVLAAAPVEPEIVENPAGKAPKVEPAPGPEAQTGKPTTVDDILAEVGDDVEKAKAALEVELVSEKPRKGVVEPLEKLIADAEAAAQ
ncbi:MAG: hypothetical protein H6515_14665 [Microthrixaceae bacterium]|nr:hypothetical protein [Microthrixaceae bacterium]MCB9377095.1 hypothetical protein [Microthrixaceae bacterium]